MPGPCACPTAYCEYDADTVDLVAGGATIDKAEENAKRRAKRAAEGEARAALEAAMKDPNVCSPPCEAWFKIVIGEPDAQEYPFHGRKRQFAIGWCDWNLVVKCELPTAPAPKPRQSRRSKGRPG